MSAQEHNNPSRSTEKTFWDGELFHLSNHEIKLCSGFREWLRGSGTALGSFLADVSNESPRPTFLPKEVRQLEQKIVDGHDTEQERVVRLQILAKTVYYLNLHLQKSIPQPRLAMLKKRDKNPFTDVSFLEHWRVWVWLNAERKWVESLANEKSGEKIAYDVPVALIAFSAALHCGVLDSDTLVAIGEALKNPKPHFRYKENYTLSDLVLAWRGLPNQEIRRWYIDDKLGCLIARVSSASVTELFANESLRDDAASSNKRATIITAIHKSIVHKLSEIIRILDAGDTEFSAQLRSLREQGIDIDDLLPRSMPDMFTTIAHSLRSEIPSVMVEYFLRNNGSRSLDSRSIERIYGHGVVPVSQVEVVECLDIPEEAETVDSFGGETPRDMEPDWLITLRGAFRSGSARSIEEVVEHLPEERTNAGLIGRRVFEFTSHLLRHGSSSGNSLAFSSIKACSLTVGRHLGRMADVGDPATATGPAVEMWYRQALENAAVTVPDPRRLRLNVAWALREFHRYLVGKHNAAPINESSVFAVSRGLLPVDARIISIDDCYQTIRHIENRVDLPEGIRIAAKIETALGFFAGLRRMEGLGLRTIDYPGGHAAPVFVREWKMRGLKTANATRWIPLRTFIFRPPEMNDLPDLCGMIQTWAANVPRAAGEKNGTAIFKGFSDDQVIPVIHQALQHVTGDSTMHYHILRHSFATWTFLRLMLSDLPEIPDLFPDTLPITKRWVRASKLFRQQLYGNDLVTNDHAWALSTLLGHSSPEVSFENYIHCLDLIAPLFLQRSKTFGACTDAELKLASGLHRSTAGDWLAENATKNTISVRTDIPKRVFEHRFGEQQPIEKAGASTTVPARRWIDATSELLFLREISKQPVYDVAAFAGFSAEDAERLLARAAEFASLKLIGSKKFAHLVVARETDSFTGATETRRLACPVKPRLHSTQQFISKFANPIMVFANRSPRHKAVIDYCARNLVELDASLSVFFSGTFDQATVDLCLTLLEEMGFTNPKLQSHDGSRNLRPSLDWGKRWGLTARMTKKVTNRFDAFRRPELQRQWLAIEPEPVPKGAKESGREKVQAFWYVVLMAAIRFS